MQDSEKTRRSRPSNKRDAVVDCRDKQAMIMVAFLLYFYAQ